MTANRADARLPRAGSPLGKSETPADPDAAATFIALISAARDNARLRPDLAFDVRSPRSADDVCVGRGLDPEFVDAALYAHVMAQPVIGLDQTGWPRLESGASKPWQMWCLTAPGVVVHRIRDDKSAATFGALVGNFHGTIVCDALKTHEAGAREGPGIAGCWAHYPALGIMRIAGAVSLMLRSAGIPPACRA